MSFLTLVLISAAVPIPKASPGIENIKLCVRIVPIIFPVLNPSALSIPNSKVFSSTSLSIRE